LGEPKVSVCNIRRRSADRHGENSRRGEEALASHTSLFAKRDTKQDERCRVSGAEREHRPPRDGLLAVFADHSPEDWEHDASWSGRWGTNVPGPHGREGEAGQHALLEGPRGETPGSPTVSMQRQSIAPQAKRDPALVCDNVLHLIAQEFFLAAYRQTRKNSAPGADQVTAQQYAEHLDDNLRDLYERRRDKRYVAPPVARVWIEKDDGTQRPRGKPCFEDKIVQRAVVMILEAIFEEDFHAFSHGCRKGHSPHQALHERREQCRTLHINGRVDADVSGFFDNLDWSPLREFMPQRVRDGGILRLIGKWLPAGVLEAGALLHPDKGTPQGGVIKRKTVGKRLRRFMQESWTWWREHRHAPLQEQYRTLGAKRRGYYHYAGIRGNFKMLEVVFEHIERAWHYWLSTRSHKGHINWPKCEGFLRQKLPLPKPRILHNI
jgi:retron-type reverse transcriptase